MWVFIIPLLIILAIVIAILIGIAIIKHKVNATTQKYLGMSASQTADLISKGLKEEVTTPKSISNLSAVYKPKLQRDFPGMQFGQFESMAKNALTSALNAIESEDTSILKDTTLSFNKKVEEIISDNKSRKLIEHFDNYQMHRISISDYKKTSDTASVDFEISFQCNHFYTSTDGRNVENKENTLTQYAARVQLVYGRSFEEDTAVYSHNCPNCGAPVYAVGENKVCEYCGCGFTESFDKSWLAGDFSFIK